MRMKRLLLGACISALMAVVPAASAAVMVNRCSVGRPTAASYTWNFRKEANNIFEDIQADASQAAYHADQLQSFQRSPDMSWQSDADQLSQLKTEINDMEARMCRLETIRRVVAPWQQRSINRIAATVQVMADNAQDAIVFLNNNHNRLWSPTFRDYANNLYSDASSLNQTTDNAVEYAKVGTQYRNLRTDINMKASS